MSEAIPVSTWSASRVVSLVAAIGLMACTDDVSGIPDEEELSLAVEAPIVVGNSVLITDHDVLNRLSYATDFGFLLGEVGVWAKTVEGPTRPQFRGSPAGWTPGKFVEVAFTSLIDGFVALDVDVPVILHACAGRNQSAHDHVLFQSTQVIDTS